MISSYTQTYGFKRPSNEYYAFRHLGYADYCAVQVVYTLMHTLKALPEASQELTVIRHKTVFWLKEIKAAYTPDAKPAHPLAQDLQQLLKTYSLPESLWVKLITNVENEIDGFEQPDYTGIEMKLYESILGPKPASLRILQQLNMVECSPLKKLWISLRERLFPST